MLQDDTDFNPQDYAGGNYDDAYVLGQEDGAIMFAQELVNKFLKDDS